MSKIIENPLTFEEHQEIGKIISVWDKDLQTIRGKLERAYPNRKDLILLIKKIDDSVTRLRNRLDKMVCDDENIHDPYLGKTYQERISVYYGPVKGIEKTEIE